MYNTMPNNSKAGSMYANGGKGSMQYSGIVRYLIPTNYWETEKNYKQNSGR